MKNFRTDERLVFELGQRARLSREKCRYRVSEVAEDLNVSRTMVYLFEGGKSSGNISLSTLMYYVKMFDLDINGLLKEFEE